MKLSSFSSNVSNINVNASLNSIWSELNNVTEASTLFYTKTQTKSSFVNNSSLGTGFLWTAGMLYVNASTAGGTSYAYVDGSLSKIDASINTLFTNSLISYITTLNNAAITSIIVGNKTIDRSVTFEYTLSRGLGYRVGRFDILNGSLNIYMGTDEFIDNSTSYITYPAISFSTSFSGNNMRVDASVDSSGGNTTIKYNLIKR